MSYHHFMTICMSFFLKLNFFHFFGWNKWVGIVLISNSQYNAQIKTKDGRDPIVFLFIIHNWDILFSQYIWIWVLIFLLTSKINTASLLVNRDKVMLKAVFTRDCIKLFYGCITLKSCSYLVWILTGRYVLEIQKFYMFTAPVIY